MKTGFEDLLVRLGLKRLKGSLPYAFDDSLIAEVVELAKQEQVTEEVMATELMATAISLRKTNRVMKEQWETLSGREKDVAALTCLGYTNQQIAGKLNISKDTVKGYVRQVLIKFGFRSKGEFLNRLDKWDFSNWGPEAPD